MTPQDMAELHVRVSNSPWSADSFAQQIEQPNALLAFNEHAFAIGRAILDEAELLQIATDPDHQRQGLGRQVLPHFLLPLLGFGYDSLGNGLNQLAGKLRLWR